MFLLFWIFQSDHALSMVLGWKQRNMKHYMLQGKLVWKIWIETLHINFGASIEIFQWKLVSRVHSTIWNVVGMCRCVYGLVTETCRHFSNSKAPDFAFKSFSCMYKIGHKCYGNTSQCLIAFDGWNWRQAWNWII